MIECAGFDGYAWGIVIHSRSTSSALAAILLLGFALRSVLLNQPWGTKDHYNFGGPFIMAHVFCLRETPWSQSRGILHTGCAAEADPGLSPVLGYLDPQAREKLLSLPKPDASRARPVFYGNHPITYPVLLAGWSGLLGEKEWVFRLFTILFSVANIGLVFAVARAALRDDRAALLAAFFQAGFQGGIYFGSHVDFLGEFTTFFMLLTTLQAVRRRWGAAAFFGVLSGLADWPGFFIFAPLSLVALLIGSRRAVLTVLAGGALAVLTGLWMVAYLQNWEIMAFLRARLVGIEPPAGAPPPAKEEWLWLRLAHNTLQTYSRFLSPLFCAFALDELWGSARRILRERRISDIDAAVLMIGGTMLITAIAGPLYVMIHSFWFLLGVPAAAWLAARFVARRPWEGEPAARRRFVVLLFVTTAFFPFGMWKYSLALDLFVGLGYIALSIAFAAWIFRPAAPAERRAKLLAYSFMACVLLNFLQTLNYRLEPVDSRLFCADLLKEYAETGRPVRPERPLFLAERYYYCRGIPLVQ